MCFISCRGIRYRLELMCGAARAGSARLGISPSHTCRPRPSCCPPFTVSSVMCPHRCESLLFSFSTVCCPAVRIHNHTVLPSSHNSSSVYTNDSAYTNISATVGEHSVPPRLLEPEAYYPYARFVFMLRYLLSL